MEAKFILEPYFNARNIYYQYILIGEGHKHKQLVKIIR